MNHLAANTYPILMRSNLLTKRGLKQDVQLSRFGLIKPTDTSQIRAWKTIGVWLLVMSFTVPIFRSGGRTNLTFISWLVNHTVFGPRVEYVPFEDYSAELE